MTSSLFKLGSTAVAATKFKIEAFFFFFCFLRGILLLWQNPHPIALDIDVNCSESRVFVEDIAPVSFVHGLDRT